MRPLSLSSNSGGSWLLNHHKAQLSYRTMPSLAKIIEGHNTKDRVVANDSDDSENSIQNTFATSLKITFKY